MTIQLNAALKKGKPGAIRGRKAYGSANADGRVADRENGFLKTHLRQQRRVFLCPQKDSAVPKHPGWGGDLNPG